MGGCISNGGKVDEAPLIVDVEQVLAHAAWDMYYHALPRCRRICMRRKNFRVDVPMHYFQFKVTKEDWPAFNDAENELTTAKQNQSRRSGPTESGSSSGSSSRDLVGLKTEFRNSTGEKQTYNFKCEKSRKSTITVTYQKGFTFGGKVNFTLGLPKVTEGAQLSNEIDMRVSVTKTTGDAFEQTLATCATSDITVAGYSHYTATVSMQERHLQASYKVWVMMSMPAKKAKIIIYNKQGEPVHYHTLKNLSELFSEDHHLYDKDNVLRDDAVEFVVEGQVDGIQLASHHIDLIEHEKTTGKKEQLKGPEEVDGADLTQENYGDC